MTDYAEDQASELETLRSIYTEEEFTEVSEDPACFQILVQSEDDTVSMNATLQFTYTPKYPDVAPEVTVTSHTGLSEQQVKELESHINDLVTENLGMVMIFTLVSGAQDKLLGILDMLKNEREEEARQKEEELKRIEEARFFGTTVTKENFLEWRKKFNEEMRLNMPSSSEQSGRLTGRQMFEKDATLALSDARFLTEVSDVADSELPKQAEVEVDESLFQELDDLQM